MPDQERSLTIFEKSGIEEEIRRFIDPRNQGSPEEHKFFFEICKSRNLNPFTKEVYFIKYGSQNAAIVIGVDTFISRANEHHDYMGFKSGWIVINEEGVAIRTEIPHGKLYGSWCEIHRKDKVVLTQTVVFSEYSTGKNRWHSAPFQMIEKVAQATAHRKAYPKAFQHLYGWEEMDQAKQNIKVVNPSESQNTPPQEEETPTAPKILIEDSNVGKLVEKLENTGEPVIDNADFLEAYHAPQKKLDETETGPEKFLMKKMIKCLNMGTLKECWEKEILLQFETNDNIAPLGKTALGEFKDLMKLKIEADKTLPINEF